MSRTPLGYFESPLSQEERDMIAVPFLGNKNKNVQQQIYRDLEQKVNNVVSIYSGCAIDQELMEIINEEFSGIIFKHKQELYLKYSRQDIDDLFNPNKLWITLINGEIVTSEMLKLLSQGLCPFTLARITKEDIEYHFVDFANNNIELFLSDCIKSDYAIINEMLSNYIDQQVTSSHIGNKTILDHSEFITQLINTFKKTQANADIENNQIPFTISSYTEKNKNKQLKEKLNKQSIEEVIEDPSFIYYSYGLYKVKNKTSLLNAIKHHMNHEKIFESFITNFFEDQQPEKYPCAVFIEFPLSNKETNGYHKLHYRYNNLNEVL